MTTFKNVFQYQTANFNNAKPQLLLHQPNTSCFTGCDFLSTITLLSVSWKGRGLACSLMIDLE